MLRKMIIAFLICVLCAAQPALVAADSTETGTGEVLTGKRSWLKVGFGCLLGGVLGTFLLPGPGTIVGCAALGGGTMAYADTSPQVKASR